MDPAAAEVKRKSDDCDDGAAVRMREQLVEHLRRPARQHRYAFAPQSLAGGAHPLRSHVVEVGTYRQATGAVVEGEDGASGTIRYRGDQRRVQTTPVVAGEVVLEEERAVVTPAAVAVRPQPLPAEKDLGRIRGDKVPIPPEDEQPAISRGYGLGFLRVQG